MSNYKCPNCGADLQYTTAMKFCSYCGKMIPMEEEITNNITLNHTNRNTYIYQTQDKPTAVDKFLEHRKSMKVLKTERDIAKNEDQASLEYQKRLLIEEKRRLAEEQRRISEAEYDKVRIKAKEDRKKKTIITLIIMSPILIPILIVAFFFIKNILLR